MQQPRPTGPPTPRELRSTCLFVPQLTSRRPGLDTGASPDVAPSFLEAKPLGSMPLPLCYARLLTRTRPEIPQPLRPYPEAHLPPQGGRPPQSSFTHAGR